MKLFKHLNSWSDFYKEPADISRYIENITVHKEFFEEILKVKPREILEVGCGSGTFSIFLSHLGCSVTAVDKDEQVIRRAKEASKNMNGNIVFKISDAFELPFKDKSFDVSFSQGLIEHFSDSDIVRLLKEQTRISKCVFFSVPCIFYNSLDFGNERLMSKKRWEKLLSGFDIQLSKYYYRIRTKRNFLLKLPLMYMAAIR